MRTIFVLGSAALAAVVIGCGSSSSGSSEAPPPTSASGGASGGQGTSGGGTSAGGSHAGGSSVGGSGGSSAGGSNAGGGGTAGTSAGGSGTGGSSAGGGGATSGGSGGASPAGAGGATAGGGGANAGGASAGTGGSAPATQPTVQNEAGVVCAGDTVHPMFSDTTYPCDASMDVAAIRAVVAQASGFKFLAGHWANASLPDGGCDKSTLCGQQYDPALLYINDPAYASNLTPTGSTSIPGIDFDPSTSASDVEELAFNCLRNFPMGYMLGSPPIPMVPPIEPLDDVRTGEMLVWVPNGSSFDVYRARAVATLSRKQTVSDLTGYDVVLDGAMTPAAASDVVAAIANGTDGAAHALLDLEMGGSVAATADLAITCMQKDKYIMAPSMMMSSLTVGTPASGTTPADQTAYDTYTFDPPADGTYTINATSTGTVGVAVSYQTMSTPGACFLGANCCQTYGTTTSCNFPTYQALTMGTTIYVFVSPNQNSAVPYTLSIAGPM